MKYYNLIINDVVSGTRYILKHEPMYIKLENIPFHLF